MEYEGTGYAGWQRQADQPTIQAAVEAAIRQITQQEIPVTGAGRTDAGVHALGQVASFRSDKAMTDGEWLRALNGVLPEDIVVRSVEAVTDAFHARYSARAKLYAYRIVNQVDRPALDRHRVWHVRHPLDVHAMRTGAELLLGRHDFSSFQGHPTDTDNPVCELGRLECFQDGPRIRWEARADRFLKQMVRAIVGTLVEVGAGKRAPADIKTILEARDRRAAGYTAPAHGLYLIRVEY